MQSQTPASGLPFPAAPEVIFTNWQEALHGSGLTPGIQGAVKQAAARVGIPKRVSAHMLRHAYTSHLLIANYDLQTIQRLLGHSDIKTTMIYLQTVPSVTLKEAKIPPDWRNGGAECRRPRKCLAANGMR
jgi:site-specific recombinase XerD